MGGIKVGNANVLPMLKGGFRSTILFLAILALVMLASIIVIVPGKAYAAYLYEEGRVGDGHYGTEVFHTVSDGDFIAYCVIPGAANPPAGNYGEDFGANWFGGNHDWQAVRTEMYFAWGGPGFELGKQLGIWPAYSWDGSPFDSGPEYYIASHVVLSDSYMLDGSLSTWGGDSTFVNWARSNLLGYFGGSGTVQARMLAAAPYVPAEWYGKCFILHGPGNSQDIAGRYYFNPSHYFDVNWRLDKPGGGYTDTNDSQDYGRCSVKINGAVKAANVADFYEAYSAGSSYQVYDVKSVKTGYVYKGVAEGSLTGTLDSDKSVRLEFRPITYKVAYNGNGATAGSMANTSHTYDLAANLRANAYRRAYSVSYDSAGGSNKPAKQTATYSFAGWNTRADGKGTSYSNSQSVKNLTAVDNGTVTMYAKWSPVGVTLSNPGTRTGYVFEGWYSGNTRVGGAGDKYTPTGNITLTAKWNAIVTYVVDGDAKRVTNQDVVKWNNAKFTVPAARTTVATRADCHHLDGSIGFDGWYTDAAYTKKWVDGTSVTKPTTLYARNWASVRYAHGPASDPNTIYALECTTSGGGYTLSRTGEISDIMPLPAAFEKPYNTVCSLDTSLDHQRVYFEVGATFPNSLFSLDGWCADAQCAQSPSNRLTLTNDRTLYKPWKFAQREGTVAVK